jgi:hypothetical protein
MPRQAIAAKVLEVLLPSLEASLSHVSASFKTTTDSHMDSQVSQQVESTRLGDGSVTPERASPTHLDTLISLNNSPGSPHTPQGSVHNLVVSVPSSSVVNTDKETESTRGTGVFLGGRYSREEVISFGGILESAVLGVRISERIKAQSNADATQLERAQQHVQARDDILYSSNKITSHFTIAAIPNDVVLARASELGIYQVIKYLENSSCLFSSFGFFLSNLACNLRSSCPISTGV